MCDVPLYRLLTLGTVLSLTAKRAQLFVLERVGGYNILTLGWAAPYCSLGSVQVVHLSAGSPLLVHHLSLNQLAHQRGV